MTHSTDSLEGFVTAVRTDLRTWLQLLPFRQPMHAGRPPRYFVAAVFVSLVIHTFLVYLLWGVVSDRLSVEPTAHSIGTPLIVSLSTFVTASHDELDREVVSVVPRTGPPAQRSQSSPERSRSAERRAEAEPVVASKDQEIPGSEAPEGKSIATDVTPSIDIEAVYRIPQEVGRMSETEAESVVTSKGQGVPGSEAPESKSLATDATPSIDLEAAYRIAREVGRMSEPEAQSLRFASRRLYYKKNHLGIARAPRPNCRTAHAAKGLLAIPFLLKDTITDSGCQWDQWRVQWRAVQWEHGPMGSGHDIWE